MHLTFRIRTQNNIMYSSSIDKITEKQYTLGTDFKLDVINLSCYECDDSMDELFPM